MRAAGGRRDQRQRMPLVPRVVLEGVEAVRRLAVERLGDEVDLAVGRLREGVDELDGRVAAVGERHAVALELAAHPLERGRAARR